MAGRPIEGSEKKQSYSVTLPPKLVDEVDEAVRNVGDSSSRSDVITTAKRRSIMDIKEATKLMDDQLQAAKVEGKPYCIVCSLRDFKTGEFEESGEKYLKGFIKKREQPAFDRINGQTIKVGTIVDFVCPNGHGVGTRFEDSEWAVSPHNSKKEKK